jgi:hypothetical protein
LVAMRRGSECPLMAEAVEKVFRGVRGERLIRQQTERRNNDLNIVPPKFDCCGNTILELCSPTFSTASAISGHTERCARTSALPPKADIGGAGTGGTQKADIGCPLSPRNGRGPTVHI